MDNRSFTRILLIRRKALGDALVTMRAVLEVARAWPDASIDLVIDRPFAPLLDGLAGSAERPGKFRVVSWPPEDGQSWLRILRGGRYDLVIDWLGSPRTALWTMLTGASVRVGYDLPRRRWAYNVKVPRNRSGGRDLRGFAGEAFLDPCDPWVCSQGHGVMDLPGKTLRVLQAPSSRENSAIGWKVGLPFRACLSP